VSEHKKHNGLSCLSKREKEVVGLIVKGNKTSSIGQKLGISEKTVRNHIHSIYGKLEVKDRLELVYFATRNGVSPDPDHLPLDFVI
jgi:DNA-binding NarL/FixJ family response regulator